MNFKNAAAEKNSVQRLLNVLHLFGAPLQEVAYSLFNHVILEDLGFKLVDLSLSSMILNFQVFDTQLVEDVRTEHGPVLNGSDWSFRSFHVRFDFLH